MTARRGLGITLAELARELPMSAELVGDPQTRVFGVHHDSRRVEPGDLFVARRGQKSDGSAFAEDAKRRGAVAVLVEGSALASLGLPELRVADARRAMAFAAAAVYGHPAFSLDIVGITGTNGKTTTSHLVRAAIDAAEGTVACGVIGTLGHSFGPYWSPAEHTTPESDEVARVLADMRERGATHVVMEVSSIALELDRARAIRFRVAAFTNLTQDHLDFHQSMQAYGEAKAKLFTEAGPGVAVINVDDAFGRALALRSAAPVVRTSARLEATSAEADVAPVAASIDRHALRATFRTPLGEVRIESRLVGRHNLENLAVALGVACALELDVQRAALGLSGDVGVPGRLERCDGPDDGVTVLVDYAHTPDALVRALEASRGVTAAGSRLFCVFGCGGDRDATKRSPMGEAAGAGADVVIVTSDNPRSELPESIATPVAEAVRSRGLPELTTETLPAAARGVLVELDRARAIRMAVLAASPGDCVLVAGKGHEDYQIVGVEKRPFDDRIEARRALEARRTAAHPTRTPTGGS